MSVVNEFYANVIKVSHEEKKIYIICVDGVKSTFDYTIKCEIKSMTGNIYFFMQIKSNKCLIVLGSRGRWDSLSMKAAHRCAVMRFWIEGDSFKLSANWLAGQDHLVLQIEEQFKDQYSSYLIDEAINS